MTNTFGNLNVMNKFLQFPKELALTCLVKTEKVRFLLRLHGGLKGSLFIMSFLLLLSEIGDQGFAKLVL